MKIKLDYLAMVCGAMGSLMVSMPNDWQRVIGFCLFLSANLMWLTFCWSKPEWRAVLFLNLFYLVTSLIGIWNNFF
jgi:hypothetical protein